MRHPLATITDELAAQIRANYTGRYGELKELANHYGVSYPTMKNVVHGRARFASIQ
jgi:hypothetical protein